MANVLDTYGPGRPTGAVLLDCGCLLDPTFVDTTHLDSGPPFHKRLEVPGPAPEAETEPPEELPEEPAEPEKKHFWKK